MNNSGIKFGEKVGYSLGDVGANLAFQMMMIYQLKFYTDVFGLDGAVAGLVLLVAPFLTAFVDPLVGIVADRTRTRWGKYRPWLLWIFPLFGLVIGSKSSQRWINPSLSG